MSAAPAGHSAAEHRTGGPQLKNAFGLELFPLRDVIGDEPVLELGLDLFAHSLKQVGALVDKQQLRAYLKRYNQVDHLAPEGRDDWTIGAGVVGGAHVMQRVLDLRMGQLVESFRTAFAQGVTPPTGRVLDLGCGNGRASDLVLRLGSSPSVPVLADIHDYRLPEYADREFHLLGPDSRLPFADSEFDSCLLITVLHHSTRPRDLLQEALRVTSGRLFIMESVVGLHEAGDLVAPPASSTDEATRIAFQDRLLAFTDAQQVKHASLHDWFVNFLSFGWIEAPYNFGKVSDWTREFGVLGLRPVASLAMGLDQLAAPELHMIYVLERK